jgi:hypothetical protein
MPLEFARAVHSEGIIALLRSHVLPQLEAAGEKALWLHLADEAMSFEKRLGTADSASYCTLPMLSFALHFVQPAYNFSCQIGISKGFPSLT